MVTPNSLVFFHVNAESLQPHFADIEQIINAHNVHVLGIRESWLKSYTPSPLFHIPVNVLVPHDRISNIQGGVAIFIHESLNFKTVAQFKIITQKSTRQILRRVRHRATPFSEK